MRFYRNISGSMLPLDCLTYTKYLMPGEIAALPDSRDVRHNARQGKLVLVRGMVESKPRKKKKKYRPRKKKTKVLEKKTKPKKEKQSEKTENK